MNADVTIKYTDGTEVTRKYASQEKYDKNNTVQIRMKLNKKTDADILDWLDRQPTKQGAIKKLIRGYTEG